MGSHAETGYQKRPQAHALHHLQEMPWDCILLTNAPATNKARKKTENQDKSRVERTLGVSRLTLHTHQGARDPVISLCVGQRYLSLGTALGLCGIEVPLPYTLLHSSKHNRSVLFIQCD